VCNGPLLALSETIAEGYRAKRTGQDRFLTRLRSIEEIKIMGKGRERIKKKLDKGEKCTSERGLSVFKVPNST